jgi:Fe-S cluster biogenesis protein NfuA
MNIMVDISLNEKVIKSLEKVRPFLQADDGDVQLISISDDGIVKIKFSGACLACPMSPMTLRAGIERQLLLDVPDIRRVEAIIN